MHSVRRDPEGPFKHDPLTPHNLLDRLTRPEDTLVLCHLGVPRIDVGEWSLSIEGMVDRPSTLRFPDLTSFPKTEIATIHQCCGSPLEPFKPTRRICNVRWCGALLSDVLAGCAPHSDARYVWSFGADWGEFAGVAADAYTKDLPISRIAADVLIAYELNGAPLPAENGYPARLVIPGFYGTNNVKWLVRIVLAERRSPGPFTTKWYNDPVLDTAGRDTGQTTPVWSIQPESVIVSPAPHESTAIGVEREIWGWCWADQGIRRVAARTDDRGTWLPANVEAARGREWRRFWMKWTPRQPGAVLLASRAEGEDGAAQPPSGRRNEIYEVPVTVA